MITIKSSREIDLMRAAGRMIAKALSAGGALVRPGVTTLELDAAVEQSIRVQEGDPCLIGYRGYRHATCVSVGQEVIHGIPSKKRKLREGELVSIDVSASLSGYVADSSATFFVGKPGEADRRLAVLTRQAFFEALKFARDGYHISDISRAIQSFCESHGYSVVRDYTGHGIGKSLHEEPDVPCFVGKSRGARLTPGMTICIEPMVCAGHWAVEVLRDGWTVVAADGKNTAHYEHTVLITNGDPVLLTERPEDELSPYSSLEGLLNA